MCGFAGALRLRADFRRDAGELSAKVTVMSEAIAHRGPDDSGLWVDHDAGVALGHRRLAIVDLSPRGHQPMHFARRYVIAFNGEIYNFRELRAQLATLGHAFASNTDTEVIMAAVHQWGIADALSRMVGMFAFALWDSQERALYLARDRLGEKPLYYGVSGGWLYFGSELHCLESVGLGVEPADEALALYLRHGYVPAPFSMWRGIHKLPQASWLRITADSPDALRDDARGGTVLGAGAVGAKYWSVPAGAKNPSSDEAATAQLETLLEASIRDQMQCDVPMGVFLSGGIDSTAVAAVLQKLSSGPVSSFTIKFAVPGFDESEHAAAVARHLGTRHHEIVLDPGEVLRSIPLHAATLDEPTANASYFPLRLMAQAARAHAKVILSGDAGDELFGGYNRYRLTIPLWRRLAWMPHGLRRVLARGTGVIPAALLQGAGRRADVSGQTDIGTALKKLGRLLDAAELGDSYLRLMRCWDSSAAIADVPEPRDPELRCDPEGFLSAVTGYDLATYLPDDNLAKADRATMAAGIEQRVPLLDHRIVEFARTLPDSLMIRDGVTKWLLRQVAYRHVPRAILDRPKMGFTVPMRAWLRGPLRDWAGDLLHSDALLERGRLRKRAVHANWNKFQNSDAPLAWEIWSLAMYASWLSARATGAASPRLRKSA
jgi:asparagine synthase (glutamine-hydrolysing)